MVGTLVSGCRCISFYYLDLTCDLAPVTLTFKILSWPFLRNMQEVDSWIDHWLGSIGMLNYGVIFNLGSTKVCSAAIFETYLSYDKDIWIAAIDYYRVFYLIGLFTLTTILQYIIMNFTAS